MTNSDDIGPYESADRIWSEWMCLYIFFLLLAVEFHGTIGLYRFVLNGDGLMEKIQKATRKNLKKS